MDIARALRETLDKTDLIQADLCRKTGINDAHMSQIFSGKVDEPKAKEVYLIANAMGFSVDYICELADSYEH